LKNKKIELRKSVSL